MILPHGFLSLGLHRLLMHIVPATTRCWLVGGALRDDLLGRASRDFDLALDTDPTAIARSAARALGGTFVLLDSGRNQSRVVFQHDARNYTLDFAPLRAASLSEDLRLRDFTFNALACDLQHPDTLIDPLGGKQDLSDGVLRPCSQGVLTADPLRLLKGVRHMVEFGVRAHSELEQAFEGSPQTLLEVAPERIKSELGKIFSSPQVVRGTGCLAKFRLLDPLLEPFLGEGLGYDESAVFQVLGADSRFEAVGLTDLLARGVEEHWTLTGLVRMCRFLGAPTVGLKLRKALTGLRFSRRAQSIAEMLTSIGEDSPSGQLNPASRRAALWLDRFRGSPCAAALCLASLPALVAIDLPVMLATWQAQQVRGRVPDLVPAATLMERFGLLPGERIGKALDFVREEEISGRISSVFEAIERLSLRLKKD